jgi:stalled ribosome alternative rescue factor ArfA
MKNMKRGSMKIKARVNKEGYMGSASREHRVKKGKGSYRRQPKHKKF